MVSEAVMDEIVRQWRLSDEEKNSLLPSSDPIVVQARQKLIIEVAATLHGWLSDKEAIAAWLRKPQAELRDREPLNLMMGSLKNLHDARDFIEFVASGRN